MASAAAAAAVQEVVDLVSSDDETVLDREVVDLVSSDDETVRDDDDNNKKENKNKKRRAESSSEPARQYRVGDHFQNRGGRAGPGQPPRERKCKAYNYPFAELSVQQKAVARDVLGIIEATTWEQAMPRRIQGYNVSTVRLFQTKTWSQLNAYQQQRAAEHLHMDQEFWDSTLAPFHDDLWRIPGITLTTEEFEPVLATIQRMAQSNVLTKKDVTRFLFSLEKLLLPSQGVRVAETLKASSSWQSLLESVYNRYNSRFHVHLVVACFLTYPERFVNIFSLQLLEFWDDDSSGCVWGNASGRIDSSNNNGARFVKPYRERLNDIPVRRTVAPILTRTLPKRILRLQETNQPQQPPALPKEVVKYILNEMLGTSATTTIDPHQISWLQGYGVELTHLF